MFLKFLTTAALLIATLFVRSQDSTAKRKISVLPVPAIGYSPETRTYIGAVALFTFRSSSDVSTRSSNAKIEFNYTWNKQVILECGWNLFSKKEKWFSKGLFNFSKYPDLYYGIGPNTPDSNKLNFNSNRINVEVFALKNVGKHWFAGPNIKYINYSKINYTDNRLLYPELLSSTVSGFGLSLLKDSRNSILTPIKGIYAYLNAGFNHSVGNFWEGTLDVRAYKTWQRKLTLATRFVNVINTGQPPFYSLVFLGGDKYVRGYYYGRYRNNSLSSIQSEFRFPIYWRVGMAAFGGLSLNYSTPNNVLARNTKYNYGLGVRFLVDKNENTNLRLDYAIGQNGNSGFYISFGESF